MDGRRYEVGFKEGMYIGMGAKEITFESDDPKNPARFYLNSAPAHKTYPTKLIKLQGEAKYKSECVYVHACVYVCICVSAHM